MDALSVMLSRLSQQAMHCAEALAAVAASASDPQIRAVYAHRANMQRCAAGESGEVVGDPVCGLLEAAAKAVEPTHAHTAVRVSPSMPVILARPVSPREDLSIVTGAKLSAWPLPPFSMSTGWTVPTRLSSQRVRRAAAASRRRAARALTTSGASCGMRAAGVFGRDENGKM